MDKRVVFVGSSVKAAAVKVPKTPAVDGIKDTDGLLITRRLHVLIRGDSRLKSVQNNDAFVLGKPSSVDTFSHSPR